MAIGLRIPLSVADVAFLIEEMYRGRSAISSLPTSLFLIRWRKPEGSILQSSGKGEDQQKWTSLRMSDLVCMTKKEAKVHEQEVLREGKAPEDLYDAETVKRVESRIEEIVEYEKYR